MDKGLIQEVEAFRSRYPVEEEEKNRVSQPDMPFTEEKFWKWASPGCFQGENILLQGPRLRKEYSGRKSGMDLRKAGL